MRLRISTATHPDGILLIFSWTLSKPLFVPNLHHPKPKHPRRPNLNLKFQKSLKEHLLRAWHRSSPRLWIVRGNMEISWHRCFPTELKTLWTRRRRSMSSFFSRRIDVKVDERSGVVGTAGWVIFVSAMISFAWCTVCAGCVCSPWKPALFRNRARKNNRIT